MTLPNGIAALLLAAQEVQEGRSRRSLQDQLAILFTEHLADEIGRRNMAAVVRLNETPEYSGDVCASHDFCDANMVMAPAFETVMGREIAPEIEQDCRLWGEAWDIAKRLYFPLYRDPSLAPTPANEA